MFKFPILITLTAPTCGGKNYLLEEMVKAGFGRIVSTTDRAPRDGEIEGVHYFFISTVQSRLKEQYDLFAELVTYNGTRYGVTKEEMARKLSGELPPPIVILTPHGIEEYRKFCAANGYRMFNIFVDTPEEIRLARLAARTSADILFDVLPLVQDDNDVKLGSLLASINRVVTTNNSRLKAILEQERFWHQTNHWDVVVDGTDSEKALEQITSALKNTISLGHTNDNETLHGS